MFRLGLCASALVRSKAPVERASKNNYSFGGGGGVEERQWHPFGIFFFQQRTMCVGLGVLPLVAPLPRLSLCSHQYKQTHHPPNTPPTTSNHVDMVKCRGKNAAQMFRLL